MFEEVTDLTKSEQIEGKQLTSLHEGKHNLNFWHILLYWFSYKTIKPIDKFLDNNIWYIHVQLLNNGTKSMSYRAIFLTNFSPILCTFLMEFGHTSIINVSSSSKMMIVSKAPVCSLYCVKKPCQNIYN